MGFGIGLIHLGLGVQIVAPTTRGPYCFRISALHPGADQRGQYGQLYILDSALALQERMGNVGNYCCNKNIMKMLGNVMARISSFVAAFKMMYEVEQEEIHRSEREKRAPTSARMIFDNNCRMRDQRRYNLPRAYEVAAVFFGDNGEVPKYRHVAVHSRGQNRLAFHRQNQKILRVELYKGLMDHLASEAAIQGSKLRRIIILPSSFQGSSRAMQQNYQDAMGIVQKCGKPGLFITFTCNPRWKEIEEQLFPGQTSSDRPDLIARVFRLKLKQFIDDIVRNHIFGRTVAHLFVIEFQKRGLPHCHTLIILTNESKQRDSNSVDRIVSSEIPNADQNPQLYEIVKSHMIHGPCGVLNKNSPCMEDGKCTKEFPKEFRNETASNKDGYP
ncbi:unnamed protein product [Rotaria magnacalcarata]|uniref:Helitron helicase-like domain-containing protein n=3 Tax=Rotaria TaxID=231623 RepID=A0A816V9U4_9BILA|nr:unnamed protein product [Rotaria magnacalcarata]